MSEAASLRRVGRVWIFGANINTDLIAPHKAMIAPTREERLAMVFAANRPGWSLQVEAGDLIVAGENFGAGSGRPAARFLGELGIAGVVAESIAGLFLRNAVNSGLPVLECPGIAAAAREGEVLQVDFGSGAVSPEDHRFELQGRGLPDELLEIVEAGGVVARLAKAGYLEQER